MPLKALLHAQISPSIRTAIYIALTLLTTVILAKTMLGFSIGASLAAVVSAAAAATTSNLGGPAVSPELQRILDQAYQAPLYTYPTAITQGIIPKAIHSHNDYWRPLPFYTALSNGCISIEADVWLVDGTLYVAHERAAIAPERTLQALYINPLLSVLNSTNPSSRFAEGDARNGVYDASSSQTLYLFIDLKTGGEETYPAVVQALAPLREGGWLSSVGGGEGEGSFTERQVTVIGTGNTPRALVEAASPRDVFLDGPLADFGGEDEGEGEGGEVTREVAPIASTDFEGVVGEFRGTEMNDTQLEAIRAQVEAAHGRGILVRYWNTPGWPVSTRNAVWRTLWTEGVDLVNADDLEAAAGLSNAVGDW